MPIEYIQIGRRSVELEKFKKAVELGVSIRDVCDNLGFNSTVSSTLKNIKTKIDELGLDTSHFKPGYTISEKVESRTKEKHFELNDNNKIYYEAFKNHISEGSWRTYKATVGNFLVSIGDKDFANVSVDEILKFVGERKSSLNHLRSMMFFIAYNDINSAKEKVSKDILLWLVSGIYGDI